MTDKQHALELLERLGPDQALADLGIDSLTMMEIVILVEDVLQMTINNDELRNLRTVGDVKTFIDCKVRGFALPKPTKLGSSPTKLSGTGAIANPC